MIYDELNTTLPIRKPLSYTTLTGKIRTTPSCFSVGWINKRGNRAFQIFMPLTQGNCIFIPESWALFSRGINSAANVFLLFLRFCI